MALFLPVFLFHWVAFLQAVVIVALVISFCFLTDAPLSSVGIAQSPSRDWEFAGLSAAIFLLLGHFFPVAHSSAPLDDLRMCICAGVGESLLFQGLLQTRLQKACGPILGIWLASLVFGFYHLLGDRAVFLHLTDQDIGTAWRVALIWGPIYGYIFTKQKSIFPLMLIHTVWDVAVSGCI